MAVLKADIEFSTPLCCSNLISIIMPIAVEEGLVCKLVWRKTHLFRAPHPPPCTFCKSLWIKAICPKCKCAHGAIDLSFLPGSPGLINTTGCLLVDQSAFGVACSCPCSGQRDSHSLDCFDLAASQQGDTVQHGKHYLPLLATRSLCLAWPPVPVSVRQHVFGRYWQDNRSEVFP